MLHLLVGAALGSGLVWVALTRGAKLTDRGDAALKRTALGLLADAGLLGAVGGLLGGIAAGKRAADGRGMTLGIRFWMVAVGAGGALTFGTVALRDAPSVPTSESGGPAAHVLVWLTVGWLAGVLLGAVGAAFAQVAAPLVALPIRKATVGRQGNTTRVLGAVVGGTAWAGFWAVLVALLVLLGLGVVLLSVRIGADGPALAVGGTCGCVFFALRYVLTLKFRDETPQTRGTQPCGSTSSPQSARSA
jgi:hypothetical protein